MQNVLRKFLLVLLILTIFPFASFARIKAKVVRIVDGDTVIVNYGEHDTIIRLLNINTPEKNQAGFFESKSYITELVLNRNVELDCDKDFKKDKYQRTLAYIFVGDKNVNVLIVHAGWSQYWTKYGKGKYMVAFMEAEKNAKIHKRGIWKEKGK